VNISTGAFEALTTQLAELTEQVRQLAARDMAADFFFQAGLATGETKAREALLGRAAKTSRPAAPRPSHLRVVREGAS
jgi:hypothetical protein